MCFTTKVCITFYKNMYYHKNMYLQNMYYHKSNTCSLESTGLDVELREPGQGLGKCLICLIHKNLGSH